MSKKVSFFVYALVSIIVLAGALVLLNKDRIFLHNDNQTQTGQLSDNQTEVYATKLLLNCPREITITKNNQVELLSGFLTVEPESLKNDVSIEITRKGSGDANSLTFLNNKLLASDTGFYYVKFSLPKSQTLYLTETLVVNVVNTNDFISINKTTFIQNETITFYELFNISDTSDNKNVTINNDNLIFNNNIFTASKVGNSQIFIELLYNYLKYNFNFYILINPLPDYEIIIINYNTDIINFEFVKDKKYKIQYQIKNNKLENVSQSITVQIEDNSILEISNSDENFITIKCKKQGQTTIKIICDVDITVFKELTIIFD
ncbi:MAG: hypothetical protein IKM43_01340 [Clostridia bacterium]|nr:hypothetical protein [Clostridia bacterium]